MKRLWIRIFVRVALIFAVFFLVLTFCNRLFLTEYFKSSERGRLLQQSKLLKELDLEDSEAVSERLSFLAEEHSFEVEIYNSRGEVYYTSFGSQIMEYYYKNPPGHALKHKPLEAVETKKLSGGGVFETAIDRNTDTEYLLHRTEAEDGIYVELRVQTRLLENSAQIAEQFIALVAAVCLLAALIWTYFSARNISRPVSDLSEITADMAALSFDKKAAVSSKDEIGTLAVSINTLSEKLNTTLADLKKSNEQLRGEIELERQLDKMRRGFVANVSHELKTPISIISGYAEGLKIDINPEARDKYCDIIIDESARMNTLVMGILELSKYESGQIPLKREEFSISQLLCQMGERVGFSDADITLLLPRAELAVWADRLQTEQVIKGLLENAKSYTPKGGTVEIRALERSAEALIEIHNSGSHIEEEQLSQIWQSFFRGEESRRREENHFGLGLSIVKAIISMHGKECGAYNTEEGVCFWFTLDKA